MKITKRERGKLEPDADNLADLWMGIQVQRGKKKRMSPRSTIPGGIKENKVPLDRNTPYLFLDVLFGPYHIKLIKRTPHRMVNHNY